MKMTNGSLQGDIEIPTYKTLNTRMIFDLLKFSLPRTVLWNLFMLPRLTKITAEKKFTWTDSDVYRDPRYYVRIVLPSEWSKIEVYMVYIYSDMFRSSSDNESHFHDITNCPSLTERGMEILCACAHLLNTSGVLLLNVNHMAFILRLSCKFSLISVRLNIILTVGDLMMKTLSISMVSGLYTEYVVKHGAFPDRHVLTMHRWTVHLMAHLHVRRRYWRNNFPLASGQIGHTCEPHWM